MRASPTLLALAFVSALAPLAPVCAAPGDVASPDQALERYVAKTQPAYRWSEVAREDRPDGVTVHRLELISQTWRGREWRHRLNVIVPPAATGERARPGHALLALTGGSEKETLLILTGAALRMGVPVAILHDLPNQPLHPDDAPDKSLKEDALIAHTLVQYVKTGDPEWPALLPMTRAAVSAMDALREWSLVQAAAGSWPFGALEKFVTTGGSKRGWTTWLTAVADPRVIGIAPIVYDNLNMPAQIALHMKTWGHPSPSIHDYTDAGLLSLLDSARGRELIRIVDPYSYRDRLGLPKLVLIGTNDTYWPLDAINIYRSALPGDLYFHYATNTGHSGGLTMVNAIAGFFDCVTQRTPRLPDLRLTVLPHDAARIEVAAASDAPRLRAAGLWTARVTGRDFTKAKWERLSAERAGDGWSVALPAALLSGDGRAAFIGEADLGDAAGAGFQIHTPVQVWELGPNE